jgi:hypothetical protein
LALYQTVCHDPQSSHIGYKPVEGRKESGVEGIRGPKSWKTRLKRDETFSSSKLFGEKGRTDCFHLVGNLTFGALKSQLFFRIRSNFLERFY